MRIAIDAFGGDNAPLEIIKGTIMAKEEFGHEYILTGSEEEIRECAARNNLSLDGIELVDAPAVMEMHDDAKMVFKQKANSSMGVAFKIVADGKADAVVTAGPTGAALMGGTMIVKRLKGVKRPALGAVIPSIAGHYILIDCGANTECRPEMLDQFAVLGSIYMKKMFGIDSPKVGLANNGAEDSKGTDLQLDAYKMMSKNGYINFTGNIEGRDIPYGKCQVVVADGFTGNLILKTIEGSYASLFKLIKGALTKNAISKLGALMLKSSLAELRHTYNHETVGGAPIIGLNKPVVKAHGSSDANSFRYAIKQAISWAESGVTEEIANAVR